MLELSAVFMALTFVVFAIYGVFAAAVRTKVRRIQVRMRGREAMCFAAAFVAPGAKLALTER